VRVRVGDGMFGVIQVYFASVFDKCFDGNRMDRYGLVIILFESFQQGISDIILAHTQNKWERNVDICEPFHEWNIWVWCGDGFI